MSIVKFKSTLSAQLNAYSLRRYGTKNPELFKSKAKGVIATNHSIEMPFDEASLVDKGKLYIDLLHECIASEHRALLQHPSVRSSTFAGDYVTQYEKLKELIATTEFAPKTLVMTNVLDATDPEVNDIADIYLMIASGIDQPKMSECCTLYGITVITDKFPTEKATVDPMMLALMSDNPFDYFVSDYEVSCQNNKVNVKFTMWHKYNQTEAGDAPILVATSEQ